ncbi:MAG: hypothetical protein KTQ49_01705 [Candidatus Omnitrophica bacterium]|nr:hypothetical protein [Candidatus Omnitrophota bacterium]
MIPDETKKLTRGLKDISPLFVVAPEEPRRYHPPGIQVLAASSLEGDGDGLFLNSFFAHQIASSERACSLVSVLPRHARISQEVRGRGSEPFGAHLNRYGLYWDELRNIATGSSVPSEGKILKDRDIFLDFECRQLILMDEILCLLDKWVLVLKPDGESLTEGYKTIKAGMAMNPRLRFFITLAGPVDVPKGEWIVTKFSELIFNHLGTSIGWLGWIDLSDPEKHFSVALHAGPLHYEDWSDRPDLGKFGLACWLESLERRQLAGSAAGGLR